MKKYGEPFLAKLLQIWRKDQFLKKINKTLNEERRTMSEEEKNIHEESLKVRKENPIKTNAQAVYSDPVKAKETSDTEKEKCN